MICVNDRLNKLNDEYNNKLDRVLNYIIRRCSFSDMPVEIISRMMYSVSKITNALSKGILSLIKE